MSTRQVTKKPKAPATKKKSSIQDPKKKRGKGNWKQRLKPKSDAKKPKVFKKSLQYILLLKKWKQGIHYTNLLLLKAFLTKYSKIKARRKTRISSQEQRKIAKSIRKARVLGLIPFTSKIEIKAKSQKNSLEK